MPPATRTLFNWASVPLPASYICSATIRAAHVAVQFKGLRGGQHGIEHVASRRRQQTSSDRRTSRRPRTGGRRLGRFPAVPCSGDRTRPRQTPSSRRAVGFRSFVSLANAAFAEADELGRIRLSLGGTLRRFPGTLGGRLLSCLCRFLGTRGSRCVGRVGILRPGTAGPPGRRFGLALGRRGRGSGFRCRFRGRGRRVRSFYRTAGAGCVGSRLRTLGA